MRLYKYNDLLYEALLIVIINKLLASYHGMIQVCTYTTVLFHDLLYEALLIVIINKTINLIPGDDTIMYIHYYIIS